MEITLKRRITSKNMTLNLVTIVEKICKTKYSLAKNKGNGGNPIKMNISQTNCSRLTFILENQPE